MRADVVVVGAGTAGAAAAYQLARRGVDVVCLERRELAQAGARWVNGVPGWMFDEAELPRPRGPELRGSGHRFHLVAGWGPHSVAIEDHGVLDVDMRLLVERLQRLARDAGVRFVESVRVQGFRDGELSTSHGAFRARTFVDASGLAGARLLCQQRLAARDVCVAAQSVRRVRDARAARAFFLERGAEPGETLCFTSVAGGYSIVNAHLDEDGVSILTGSIPALGVPSGRALLADFANKHDWIGDEVFGGARALPLGRARDFLAHDDVALLGDAGLQIFSAHGSGIGAGMVAARQLADVIAAGRPLHDYSVAWHRELGPRFVAYDVFRRFSQTLTRDEVETLVTSGLMAPAMARPALAQHLPPTEPAALLARVPAALRAPGLAARLAKVTPQLVAGWLASRRYPEDPQAVVAWARRTSRVLGDRGVEPAPRRRLSA